MKARYKRTFNFYDTEEQAKEFCDNMNNNSNYYVRKNHKAIYTPWSSQDGKENKFVAWYSTK